MSNQAIFELEASLRSNVGRGASRRLRREDAVPAIVYGGKNPPRPVSLAHNKVLQALEHEAFYSHILTLKTDGSSERVILKAVHRHPYKPRILHMDFQRIDPNQKLHMHVPLHFLNEENCAGVKQGGIISHLLNDIEIACLPDDLPEFIEVDLGTVNLNQTLHLSDLKLSDKISLVALAHGRDLPIVSVAPPRATEEISNEAPVAAEVPAIAQKSEAAPSAENKDSKK